MPPLFSDWRENMRKISTVELKELEVINLCGGERLGYASEFEIDLDCAQILSLIVPIECGSLFFSRKEEYIIPWNRVECIGEDAILIKIPQADLCRCECRIRGRKRKQM